MMGHIRLNEQARIDNLCLLFTLVKTSERENDDSAAYDAPIEGMQIMAKDYTVQAYLDVEHAGQWLETEEDGFSSLKDAKARARYFLTDNYRRACESSQRLSYARIIDSKSRNCIWDIDADTRLIGQNRP